MVILFLLSANIGTVVAAVAVSAAYGFWQAAVLAPLVGFVSGALALLIVGRRQAATHVEQDQISDQVAALSEIVEASKKAGQQRPAAMTRPSAEQAA